MAKVFDGSLYSGLSLLWALSAPPIYQGVVNSPYRVNENFWYIFCDSISVRSKIYMYPCVLKDHQNPRSQDPKIPRSSDPKILRSQDAQIPGSSDPKILRSSDPKILRSQDPQIPRPSDPKILRSKYPNNPRSTESQINRSTDPKTPAQILRF